MQMNIFTRTLFIILTGEPGKSFEIRGLLNIFARNFLQLQTCSKENPFWSLRFWQRPFLPV